jgi:dTMP kinase
LTLLLGGVMALGVSYYATSRATRSRTRLRDIVQERVLRTGMAQRNDHSGLFVSIDGVDPAATAGYAALVAQAAREQGLTVVQTAEPTDSPTGRRVAELLHADAEHAVEPETAALLSAADRGEHVAGVIRPALERGELVVTDRYVLTSLALHGGGRGADADRIRGINTWSTGGLFPDLTLVVDGVLDGAAALTGGSDGLDLDAISQVMHDEVAAEPDRYVLCPPQLPETLSDGVLTRLTRLVDSRAALLSTQRPEQPTPPAR